MRLGKRKPVSCEQVTQWLSLELDDELAETERFALGRHLGGCVDCRSRRAQLQWMTQALRAAPVLAPEWPVRIVVPRRHVVRKRAGFSFAGVALATAAVVLAVTRPVGAPASSLAFGSASQQSRFAHIHQRSEPTAPNDSPAAALPLSWIPVSLLR
jgi:predicted anti-sigma-YlaC factor YlaD